MTSTFSSFSKAAMRVERKNSSESWSEVTNATSSSFRARGLLLPSRGLGSPPVGLAGPSSVLTPDSSAAGAVRTASVPPFSSARRRPENFLLALILREKARGD